MKYSLIAFFICICFGAFSQAQFEGKIIYKATGTEKNDSGYLTIYFGKPGIRIELAEAKNPDKTVESVIINLDSGKTFAFNSRENRYKESLLKKKPSTNNLVAKNIAGYITTPTTLAFSNLGPVANLFKEPVLHVAQDLHYTIPEIYVGNLELVMVQNNKIVLGAEFFIDHSENEWSMGTPDTIARKKNIFNVFASQVINEKNDVALFAIPDGFTKRQPYDYGMDSTAIATDTAVAYPVDSVDKPKQDTPVKKKKSSPKKKTSATKENATRRKDD